MTGRRPPSRQTGPHSLGPVTGRRAEDKAAVVAEGSNTYSPRPRGWIGRVRGDPRDRRCLRVTASLLPPGSR